MIMERQHRMNQTLESIVFLKQVQGMMEGIKTSKQKEYEIRQGFEEAMNNKEFVVYYQPKVNADTNQIIGAEALTRWRKPDGTMVSPAEFIPVYEENGLIERLDEYVFQQVCEFQKQRMEQKKEMFPISVNLSRASINNSSIVDRYVKIAKNLGIPFSCVPLELTESAAIEKQSVCETARAFVQKGFSLHLDDFGSGYSSLMSLNQIPFSTMKLDKHLIDCLNEKKGRTIVKQAIMLAKLLKMEVVAEGVETKEQVEILKGMGCNVIQGFYYAAPMPEEEFSSKRAEM